MNMDSYSPSHPTDDMELESGDEMSFNNKDLKTNNETTVNDKRDFEGVFKKLISQFTDNRKNESADESINARNQDNKGEFSLDKGSNDESIERRIRSEKRRRSTDRRSVSRNRRSSERRSVSRGRKGGSRDYQGRHGRSRSRDRRSRSRNRSGRNDNRLSKDTKSFDRRIDRNKKSPETHSNRKPRSRSRSHSFKDSRSNFHRRDKNIKSPEQCSSNDRTNDRNQSGRSKEKSSEHMKDIHENSLIDKESDNIFSKLSDIQANPLHDSPKEKWGFDSDEEVSTKTVESTQEIFSNNRGGFSNYDGRSSRGRNDFNDRRNRGSFRGFQRGSQWGQDRHEFSNENSSGYAGRNQSWGQRNNFNKSEVRNSPWTQGDNSINKSWDKNKQNYGDQNRNVNNVENTIQNSINVPVIKPSEPFNSDEEDFGSWGKIDKSYEGGAPPAIIQDDKNREYSDVNKPWSKTSSQLNTRENAEGGFAAWKNAQKAETSKSSEITIKDKFAEESDEEFGAWGKESTQENIKTNVQIPVKAPVDSDDEFGSWGKESTQENVKTNVQMPVKASVDSDDEFGTWGNERKMNNSITADSFSNESNQNDPSFPTDQRQSFQNRNNFHNNNGNFNNNNQFGQRRGGGGPRNFNNNNRFQRPNMDRSFNNNNQNNNFSGNYNSNFNNTQLQTKESLGQQVRQPFTFNPAPWNVPPQMANIAYPPMVGQLPFPLDTSVCPPNMGAPHMQHQMMQHLPFIPPPPPNLTIDTRAPPMPPVTVVGQSDSCNVQSASRNRQGNNVDPIINRNQPLNNIAQSLSIMDNSNLLETLMTQAGLSSDTLRLAQEKKQDLSSKSVGDTFSTILKSAATSVISRLVESSQKPLISDNMSMSPPSPPNSPLQSRLNSTKAQAGFVPPPLPNYADVLKPSVNNKVPVKDTKSAETVNEEKKNRSDYESKNDWQERVALEVKIFLKPAYMSRSIDKYDYKEIMKRCVTKISRSGVTEINRDKIEKFVLSYVDKYNKNRKTRQHSAVSSSERDV